MSGCEWSRVNYARKRLWVGGGAETVEGGSKSGAQGWVRTMWIRSFPEQLEQPAMSFHFLWGPLFPCPSIMRSDLPHKVQLSEGFLWESLLFFSGWINNQPFLFTSRLCLSVCLLEWISCWLIVLNTCLWVLWVQRPFPYYVCVPRDVKLS